MAKTKKKGSFVVRAKCVVTKEFVVEGCTEEQAETDPFTYIVDEREIDQEEVKVLSVRPNN